MPDVPASSFCKVDAIKPLIGITAGDVAGIGPEVIVRALTDASKAVVRDAPFTPLLIGHPEVFRKATHLCGVDLDLRIISVEATRDRSLREVVGKAASFGQLCCVNPGGEKVLQAPQCKVSAEGGDAAFQYLDFAIDLALNDHIDAICTAPLNKEALHLAGHHYPGHTEILAARCGVAEFAMMLHLPESAISSWRRLVRPLNSVAGDEFDSRLHGLSIAHVTLHTSIESVPASLTVDNIVEKTVLMSDFLKQINCSRSAVAVCALNPHGGENGLFGDEEQRLIGPAIERSRSHVANVHGPLPVDTLIRRAVSGEFDGVVAMYHDQGHIPVKLIGFDSAINITLGLPIVRTSPTHGTAFDRAWNRQTPSSGHGMSEAIRMAAILSRCGRG